MYRLNREGRPLEHQRLSHARLVAKSGDRLRCSALRLLLSDDRRVFQQSEVSPDVRLPENAQELALESPQTHRQLGRGGEEDSAVKSYHFDARYSSCMRPTSRTHTDSNN